MHRRQFLRRSGILASGSALAAQSAVAGSDQNQAQATPTEPTPNPPKPSSAHDARGQATTYRDVGHRGMRKLLFFDYFPFTWYDNVSIKQATAQYVPEGDFVDPLLGKVSYHDGGSQPFFDKKAGLWKRIEGFPKLFMYESDDGLQWRISKQPDAKKDAKFPHYLDTAEFGGFPSGMHYDPVAHDGYPYKFFVLENVGTSYRYALAHPNDFWHQHALEAKKNGGAGKFRARRHGMLVSKDAIHWKYKRDYNWGQPHLITEEHFSSFYNHHTGKHVVAMRSRWGDRRIFFTESSDFQHWTYPRLAFHPDVLDQGRVEFHGSAIVPYDSYYIGLIWYGNYSNADRKPWTGKGKDETHFTYSYDGQHFIRGHRQPLIPVTQPGQPIFNGLWTRGMITRDKDILIYSDTWERQADPAPKEPETAKQARLRARSSKVTRRHVVHRLRKDGFTYLEPDGYVGMFQTHRMVLHEPTVLINAEANKGEIHYEIGLLGGDQPAKGFTFNDCVPMVFQDNQAFALRFREHKMQELVGKMIYIRFRFQRAKFYSLTANFGTDPTHAARIQLGMPLHDTTWLY